jgi:hypothetical protein
MASIYIYRDGDKFTARVNRGLRAAEFHQFDSREAVEQFAQETAGQTGSVRSVIDMTDEEIARREQASQRAYNG